jgi:pre-60S factor REI1
MSAFSGSEVPDTGHPCVTCKAIFSSVEKVKEHYRGDWHIFNSKRRAHDMIPLSKAEFKSVTAARSSPSAAKAPVLSHMEKMISSAPWSGTGGTGNVNAATILKKLAPTGQGLAHGSAASGTAGVGSRRLQRAQENRTSKGGSAEDTEDGQPELSWGGITALSADELRESATQMGIGKERVDTIVKMAVERQAEALERSQQRRAAFLSKQQASTSSAAADTSVDETEEDGAAASETEAPAPLLGANVSIFDDREFETTEECVAHMQKEFGFFLPDREFLTDLDGLLEYLGDKVKLGGFCLYCQKQLTPGRPCQMHMLSKSHCKLAYEEGIDLDEYEDFYDFTEDNQDLPLDEDGNPMERVAQVTTTGELVLPSGNIAGHRAYKVYYKQRLSPVDTRPAVLAAQREELLRLGVAVGSDYTEDSIVAMPDVQVLTLLVRHQKERRKEMAIQYRAARRAGMLHHRIDQQVKASKLRSSEQRTQLIHDYHGRLQ